MRKITYELQDPIEFEGKTSGQVMRSVDAMSFRAPTARVFVDLERAGLLVDGHDLEMTLTLLKRCNRDGNPNDVDEMSMRDLEGAAKAMEDAGFFGSMPAPKPARKAGEEEETAR